MSKRPNFWGGTPSACWTSRQSQPATLAVEETYQNYQQDTSYALAAVLAFAAMTCLLIVSILRPKEES